MFVSKEFNIIQENLEDLEDNNIEVEDYKIRIKKDAFAGNTSIKTLTVSSKVVEIEEGAFAKMGALEELIVPFVGQYFNSDAFYGQNGSANESEKAIDKARTVGHFFGTEEYDGGAAATSNYFSNAANVPTTCYVPLTLTTITVNAEKDYAIPMDAFNGFDTPIGLKVNLSENVIAIGERAFKESGIQIIDIPASVKTIYASAFESSKLKVVNLVERGNDKIIVKDAAFKGCNKMVKIGTAEVETTQDGIIYNYDAITNYTIDLAKFSNEEVGEFAFDFGVENKTFTLENKTSFSGKLDYMFGETKYN